MKREIYEKSRNIPVIGEYDVVVVGGGIAGVSAALSASRNGAKVCIIEKENSLGGLATLGLVVIYLPLCDGAGNQVVGGIGEELLKLSIKDGPGKIPECWIKDGTLEERKTDRYELEFNPSSFVISLEECALKNDIKLYYDSRFCDAVVENNVITSVVIENKSGRCALSCKTVVDTSGDADVCFKAGENTVSLNTNRRSGWFYSYNHTKIELHKVNDPLYEKLPEHAKTYAGDNFQDVTEMNIEARKMILQKLSKLKQQEGNEEIYPILIPTIPEFRMTRRLSSSFELDEEDDKIYFNDSIGMTGDWRKSGPILYIPYRCLIGTKIKNLIAAGRCISVTTSAWDITRAIPACAVTGQAAGAAAAIASLDGCDFRGMDISKLQIKLKEQGVIINEIFSTKKE